MSSPKETAPSDKGGGSDFNPATLRAEVPVTGAGPDPFDLSSLRLAEDVRSALSPKKVILSIPARKPDKSWWVRVHPDESYRIQTAVLEMKEDRELYLVARELWTELSTEPLFRPKLIATAINTQGDLFLWEANLPRSDRKDEWTRTALTALEAATKAWVRVVANTGLGAYEMSVAPGQLGDPRWPELTFQEILKIAFKDRFISTLDHPVLRKLRGEA